MEVEFNRHEGLTDVLRQFDETPAKHRMEYLEEVYLRAVGRIEKLEEQLSQHPTPTLTDKVIEDIVENSVTKNYVDGKFYAMRVARVALKKARDFMQSGEANSDFELQRLYDWLMDESRKPAITAFTSGMTRNVAREIEFRLPQSGEADQRKGVFVKDEAHAQRIYEKLSGEAPQESKGDGVDLESELSKAYQAGVVENTNVEDCPDITEELGRIESMAKRWANKYLSTRQGEGEEKPLVCPRCGSNKIAPSEDHPSFTDCEHCGMTWIN